MPPFAQTLSRREFLAATIAAAAASSAWKLAADETAAPVAFFLIGDTHYLANKDRPSEMDERSAKVTSGLVETLNRLPGSIIPENAGGGSVLKPQGVIHAGDLIDSGDKNGPIQQRMQHTEWAAFAADFGLTGQDGKLKFPVYEVHGNHDGPQGKGVAIDGIIDRYRRRPGLSGVSSNGLHYSWNWGPLHFVNLGIVVGQDKAVSQRRRYDPLESLDFLTADLEKHVATSGRPVILTQHVDVARYTGAADPADPANLNKEWNPCDVRAYYQAIRKFPVLGILYGHTHARNILTWDGHSARAEQGLSLFNVDNSSHFHSDQQAFLYFEVTAQQMLVRECATKDAWQTSFWTPQVWKRPVATG